MKESPYADSGLGLVIDTDLRVFWNIAANDPYINILESKILLVATLLYLNKKV